MPSAQSFQALRHDYLPPLPTSFVGEDGITKPGEVVWEGGYNVPYTWKWTAELKIKSNCKCSSVHSKCIKMEAIKWSLMHDNYTGVFSVPMKFEIDFLLLPWESFLWSYWIYSPWKVLGLKYSGTRLRFLSTKI